MSRYSTDYWDVNFIKTPFSRECCWECKITDTETGLIGICSSTHSSKSKAYDDAWENLMNNQREYYSSLNDKDSSRSSSPLWNSNLWDNSTNISHNTSEVDYSPSEYLSDYTPNTSKSSSDSTLSIVFGWIILVIIGAIIFDNTCGNNNSKGNYNTPNMSTLCVDCNGTGTLEISEYCQYCNGLGNYKCNACGGMKTYSCDNCRRVGFIRCPECEGNVNRGYIDCKQCNREGYIFDINNNKITCPTCRGQRVYICGKCQGSGQLYCPKCNGSGYVDCKSCKGLGNLTCSHCSGNGIIYTTYTCQKCTGKRTLIKSSRSN